MPAGTPGQTPDQDGVNPLASVAAELHRESDKLRQLADELRSHEEAEAEMRANYPHFKRAVYALLREQFERELPPLPEGVDLEALAAQEGALPLEAFLADLERQPEGQP
jgi:septation ring formation regulator EzrA